MEFFLNPCSNLVPVDNPECNKGVRLSTARGAILTCENTQNVIAAAEQKAEEKRAKAELLDKKRKEDDLRELPLRTGLIERGWLRPGDRLNKETLQSVLKCTPSGTWKKRPAASQKRAALVDVLSDVLDRGCLPWKPEPHVAVPPTPSHNDPMDTSVENSNFDKFDAQPPQKKIDMSEEEEETPEQEEARLKQYRKKEWDDLVPLAKNGVKTRLLGHHINYPCSIPLGGYHQKVNIPICSYVLNNIAEQALMNSDSMDAVAATFARRFPSVCVLTPRPSQHAAHFALDSHPFQKASNEFINIAREEREQLVGHLSSLDIVAPTSPVALVMPVNMHNVHWQTIAANIEKKEIWAFDSIPNLANAASNVKYWIEYVKIFITSMGWDVREDKRWQFKGFWTCPEQSNGIDCGRFALWNALSAATVLQSGGDFPRACAFQTADFVQSEKGRKELLDIALESVRVHFDKKQ
jgi:hypothetical protein